MKYAIDKTERPVYLQIYKYLRNDIIKGVFPYNSRLPSKRQLAAETDVSTITIEHAYALLCDEGYAEFRERSGFFVIFRQTDGFAVAEKTPEIRSQHAVKLPESTEFSASVLSRTMRKVIADRHDELLQKSPNSGCDELRRAIRNYLARNRGIYADTEQIIIGAGAEYLYCLIIELFGRDKKYAVESPCYEKIEQIYRSAGVEYELLPLNDDGIDSAALSSSGADILHTTPFCSYPSGITASASKRHEYIRWSEKPGRFIVESDYGSEFSVSSKPMETLFALSDKDNVLYLNTFSRTISPAVRIGYMVLPKRLVQPFRDRLGFYSCTVSVFEQYVLAEIISSGVFERYINRVRRSLRKRNEPGI